MNEQQQQLMILRELNEWRYMYVRNAYGIAFLAP